MGVLLFAMIVICEYLLLKAIFQYEVRVAKEVKR